MSYAVEPTRPLALGAAVVLLCGAASLWMAASGGEAALPAAVDPPAAAPASDAAASRRNTPITRVMVQLGEGSESLTSVIGRALKSSDPDWIGLELHAKTYSDLANHLRTLTPPRGSIESWARFTADYHASAAALVKSIEAADRPATLEAHARLANSCLACHREHRNLAGPMLHAPSRHIDGDESGGLRGRLAPRDAVEWTTL